MLIVDDSSTARNQVRETLAQLGLEVIECQDGLQALKLLKGWCDAGKKVTDEIMLMITDAEMPEMDGYTFTAEIRNNPNLKDLHVILHTSLSGVFNQAMVQKVGANNFIAKFQPDELAKAVQGAL